MSQESLVIDAMAHPSVPESDYLRGYMRPPWRNRPFPGPEEYQYTWTKGEYIAESATGDPLPGSDIQRFRRDLLNEQGIRAAILLPLTRGLLPDADLDSEICAATNRWLAEEWLDSPANSDRRLYGSIRVSPSDPSRAAREIHEWGGHPQMVQVAVRTQSLAPYGQRQYLPIWQAAVDQDLPVAIHADGGSSIGFAPTPVGQVTNPLQYHAMQPWSFAYHLASFIAEGVFDRLPSFKVIFGDGGFDLVGPLGWRLDKDWRPNRVVMPWTKRLPTDYFAEHVRFAAHRNEGPSVEDQSQQWNLIGQSDRILIYGSNYPKWDFLKPDELARNLPSPHREMVLGGSAAALFDIHVDEASVQAAGQEGE